MDTETVAVGGRGQGDDGEETWRGGCKTEEPISMGTEKPGFIS